MNNDSVNRLKKNVLLQGSILAIASIIVRLIGLVYRIPMTRILGDKAMGYYGYAFEIYNLALILSSYSIPLSVSKLISQKIVKGERRNAHKIFKFTFFFSGLVGGIMALIVFACADLYAQVIHSPNVAIPLRVLAPTIFVFSVMGVIRGYFQGLNDMFPTAISQILEQIVNAVVSIVASYLMLKAYADRANAEAYGAAGGTLGTLSGALAAFFALAAMYVIFHKRMKHKLLEDTSGKTDEYNVIFKMLLATALPVIISQTIYQISGTLDSVIFNRIEASKGISEATRSAIWGIYSNKYRLLTNLPVAVASAMGTAVVPSLIAEYITGNIEGMKRKIASVVKFNMIIAFPSAIGLCALARPILMLLFGDSSETSMIMLRTGGICVIFFALSTVTNGVLQGLDKMSLPVIHSAVSLIIHIPLLMIILSRFDLGGYALVICNVVFPLVVCVLNWRSIEKLIDYKQEVLTTFVVPLVSSVAMGFVAENLYKLLDFMGNTPACLLTLALSVNLYFYVLIKLKGVTKEELLNMPKGHMLVKVLTKLRYF